jgi:hypothetical protein
MRSLYFVELNDINNLEELIRELYLYLYLN